MSRVTEVESAIKKLQGYDMDGWDMIDNSLARVISKKKKADDPYDEIPYQLFVGNLTMLPRCLSKYYSYTIKLISETEVFRLEFQQKTKWRFVSLTSVQCDWEGNKVVIGSGY